MFPLKVSKNVLRKVVEEANRARDKRTIGFLMGRMDGGSLVVEDAVGGDVAKVGKNVSLAQSFIAKVADKILRGKLKGNVVGWYHTHPGYGVSMSGVDEETQRILSQFSPHVVSLILDPESGEHKFYALNEKGKVRAISEKQIEYLEPGELPPRRGVRPGAPPPGRPTLTKRQAYALASSLTLIGLLIVGALIWSAGGFGQAVQLGQPLPSIEHEPVKSAVVGTDVTIKAEVTGGVGGLANVTIHYEWSKFVKAEGEVASVQMPWKTALMLLVAAGGDEYAYTIPDDEVLGDIDYFIVATDKAGNKISTPIYTIKVADFTLVPSTESITVYIGRTGTAKIFVSSLSGFSSEVKLSAAKPPYGIFVSITPKKVKPPPGGSAAATLKVEARRAPGTFRGTFDLEVYGESKGAKHSTVVTITVPNLEFSISPKSQTIDKGETAKYTIELKPSFNFKETVKFSVSGLPGAEASWKLTLPGNEVKVAGPMKLDLEVATTTKVQAGAYTLTVKAEGGGLKLQETVTLTIQ